MKAAFYEGQRGIRVGECVPVAAGPGQVQISVSYCGICGTDLHCYHGVMDHRVTFPQVLGHEMSGVIVNTGEGVDGFRTGDRVTVRPLDPCGVCPACKRGHSHICQKLKFIGIDAPGALQALWTVPAHTLHHLPASLSMKHAAMVEPIAVACHDVRLGNVESGEYVVVQGGGPIGILIALVCRAEGARVLLTEINPHRLELARRLGLEAVNPLETDVVTLVNDATGTAGADVVFEVSGSQAGAEMMTELPRTRGRIVIVAIFSQPPKIDLFRAFWRELQFTGARVYEPQDFEKAIALAAAGSLPLDAIISAIWPLDDLQPALEKLQGGGDMMKILMRCSEEAPA
jgi:(R,R)-butanediol dehydrogenase/meso-butanediol dehydrogenase/diacetyl reductase